MNPIQESSLKLQFKMTDIIVIVAISSIVSSYAAGMEDVGPYVDDIQLSTV